MEKTILKRELSIVRAIAYIEIYFRKNYQDQSDEDSLKTNSYEYAVEAMRQIIESYEDTDTINWFNDLLAIDNYKEFAATFETEFIEIVIDLFESQ